MFRNYLAAALRNLARNRLYAAINIIGLGIGFAAAVLVGLYIADELSYDRWIPDHERLFLETTAQGRLGQSVGKPGPGTQPEAAARLAADFPHIKIARLSIDSPGLRVGDREIGEPAFWADPDALEVLGFPLVAGDPQTALRRPDGLVMTRRMARRLFGREDVLGELVELNRAHAMQVTGILEDLPSNTHFAREILISGLAGFSRLAEEDAAPAQADRALYHGSVITYVRLPEGASPGASIESLRSAMPDFLQRRMPALVADRDFAIDFVPVADIHLHPTGLFGPFKPRGTREVLTALAAVGGLILLVASVNFVNLMTARAARRAIEIGVRKASGGGRLHIVQQFVGEALIYAALAIMLGVALAESVLPSLNGFLDRDLALHYLTSPGEAAALLALLLATGLAAGSYPGFVLASFAPGQVLRGQVLRGTTTPAGGSATLRHVLVAGQFAVLIGLVVATTVIWRQTRYAMDEGMRLDRDQVLTIAPPREGGCAGAFVTELRRLSGVRAVSCTSSLPLGLSWGEFVRRGDGVEAGVSLSAVDAEFFGIYGLAPLAGRLFAADRDADVVTVTADGAVSAPLVINETAVRELGFATPAAAIGQAVTVHFEHHRAFEKAHPAASEIIGVIPDFPVGTIRSQVRSLLLYRNPAEAGVLSVKLTGREVPETLRAIDGLWGRLGNPRPIMRRFLDETVQLTYLDITRQTVLFGLFSAIAIFIAGLGLFGLAAFTAERRTKEIGIRKAMGAGVAEVLRLLLWQFARPVLWANLVAWPAAFFAMRYWLSGFAYHIELQPWMFLAAGGAALFIALLTVAGHSLLVARTRPVLALRYE